MRTTHTPRTPLLIPHTLHAACHTPRVACDMPHTAPRRHRGRQSASGAQPQVQQGQGKGKGAATYTGSTLAREEDPTQLSYKSNVVVVVVGGGGGGCGPLPISGSHFSRAPQRVETGAKIN